MATLLERAQAVLFAVAGAAGLGSCGGSADADLLAEIRERGEFTVATEARFPPFEFVEDGRIVGYSADIMAHVMNALPGVTLNRLDVP